MSNEDILEIIVFIRGVIFLLIYANNSGNSLLQ